MAGKSRAKSAAKTPQEDDGPVTVSARELAAILSDKPFTDRWLRELADKGYLVRAGRARYELAASVRGYIRFIRETEVATVNRKSDARAEFEAERARKLKLENDERENMLIGTPLAISAVDYIVGTLRTDLAAVPARASEDVATRRRVENAIDDVLDGLAGRFEKAADALAQGRDPIEADEETAA